MSLPKGLAHKLIPKYIGPYQILRDFRNSSYTVELPSSLKQRGIHDVFHASLLRVHEPNDDCLFPSWLDNQVAELEDQDGEWAIDRIASHQGTGDEAILEAVWKSGDRTWVPYSSIAHLGAVSAYLEALGVAGIADLPTGKGSASPDPQFFIGSIGLPALGRGYKTAPR
ncbi:hypothetical protein POSPLADRAFT_1143007 [Postia placenta MAD-698-R-SB12]|uniref:Tf2-1-like SH3-like domain-containing protein n=1 Tax=Postia placenta MAD-698-R-SB12 TaxID=670580 RepID=A0A1X6N0W9_9APHY|nr:hypothetical protein POSPLADRAFT_1143007 [Postia placenta MAD-698-R-SB12]OSX62106.1 hypothetical protein POSPLADRAFT_1143007 [Postia placenta MAD-698-R-SB12]